MPKTRSEHTDNTAVTSSHARQQALLKTSALQQAILNSRYFSSIATDAEGVIQIFNAGAERMLGYTAAEVVDKLTPADISDMQELNARAAALSLEFSLPITAGFAALVFKAARGIEDIYQLTYIRKDGTRFPALLSVTALREDDNGIIGYLLIATDNTLRKLAEELQRVKTLQQQLFEHSHDALLVLVPPLWQVSAANQATMQMFGTSSLAEFCAVWPEAFTPERQSDGQRSHDKILKMIEIALADGYSYFEWQYQRLSGEEFSCDVLLTRIEVDEVTLVQASVRDITIRKQAEAALKHALRALATLGAVNSQMVHATDEQELLQAICQAVVQQPGYLLAWVGYVQPDNTQPIKIMASAGYDAGYQELLRHDWTFSEPGQGLSALVVHSGTTQLCQDLSLEPAYSARRDKALQCGYAASISLALKNKGGEVFGTFNVYADEAQAFISSEIKLLEDTAADLAFGVGALRMRQERDQALVLNQQQLARLEVNLEDTVRAISTIVEMRDPYTSGHQLRVAHLAAAIASKMGLPIKQVHGIHLAAMVHDLGKMQVPAEILSKPGVISAIEYSLIKTHAQAGYEILKGIDFPWPIAQIVLQHHERMDGSGYPQGLRGDGILLEARIISVADVVEAMSSHRPYRPSLGIEAALDEITSHRGSHFDTKVVDACLALFREQHYAFN
jgi:putative nucleotidyltransferase with HDIG domain/PAS domain S-box-containing protein